MSHNTIPNGRATQQTAPVVAPDPLAKALQLLAGLPPARSSPGAMAELLALVRSRTVQHAEERAARMVQAAIALARVTSCERLTHRPRNE